MAPSIPSGNIPNGSVQNWSAASPRKGKKKAKPKPKPKAQPPESAETIRPGAAGAMGFQAMRAAADKQEMRKPEPYHRC